jgi:aspartate oxidase
MENEDSIVVLTRKLDTLIAKTISIESLDAKLTDLVKKIDDLAETLDGTHKLVNSRMTELTAALEKAAALAQQLAGEEGEARGAQQERDRTERES